MATNINTAFMGLSRRTETNAREKLIQTFVDVGPLFTLLSSPDHQILYGRRGTGKTHALMYLAGRREQYSDAVAYIDLRNIGSSGGIYADQSRTIQERATCLLVDTLSAVHEALLSYFVDHPRAPNLSESGPALDALAEAITAVKVVGSVEREATTAVTEKSESRTQVTVGLTAATPTVSASVGSGSEAGHHASHRTKWVGTERFHVNFGAVGAAFRRLAGVMSGQRIWILLDEWSSVPTDLQPYLADLLRRSVFPTQGMTIKIAAIEQRSRFQLPAADADYIGIEVGADASADVNLDDFMVFDNDAEKAKTFFQDLLYRHFIAAVSASNDIPPSPAELIRRTFTQMRAFEEFVQSSEGVPRDAINILALAAQKAFDESISVEHIRLAAKNWYQRDKNTAVRANPAAQDLLHWIIDRVIGDRRARAFLLKSEVSNELIDSLYDSRVLHVLKRGVATHDQPGIRYDVYKLDYGCYVDLISTAKAPLGLLQIDGSTASYVEVPPDDYRSIRRAILYLNHFEQRGGPG